MGHLSALVITYNEMGYIERCLESIAFADEIIVVDSYSTDGTYEYLMEQPNVQVYQRPFTNYTEQKAFTLDKATQDWVLFVDADEVVPPALRDEILETIAHPSPYAAFWFYRTFMFQNKKLHFSGWQTDKNIRLWQRGKASFNTDKIVHETLDIQGDIGFFKAKLQHYCYKNYADYKNKMLTYGRMKALQDFKKGKKYNPLVHLGKPLWKFVQHFLLRLGFLDGKKGVTVCYLNALEAWERGKELQRLGKS